MYQASDAFHKAVADGKPQIAMLLFDDAVFTNEDINVTVGIEFNDYFNTEENLAIGTALSNEIRFSLFNDRRDLNDYAFGDFLATLGVLTGSATYQQVSSVLMTTNNAQWLGSESPPFVRRNGTAVTAQPSFAVKSMIGYNDKVYVFSGAGGYAVYDDRTGANITNQNRLNLFMRNKSKGLNGKGVFYNKNARKLMIYEAGVVDTYEFVPLGYFTAERPNAPDTIQIDMTCYDFMQKFEEDMQSAETLGFSYPVTFGTLLQKICDYVGVTLKSSTFINSTARLTEKPGDFDTATLRDVVKWIAEAGAGVARFNRDGQLEIDWIRSTTQTFTPTDYGTFDPYWYKTKRITKLYNRDTHNVTEKTVGTGDEGYLIQDNPLLRGVS